MGGPKIHLFHSNIVELGRRILPRYQLLLRNTRCPPVFFSPMTTDPLYTLNDPPSLDAQCLNTLLLLNVYP